VRIGDQNANKAPQNPTVPGTPAPKNKPGPVPDTRLDHEILMRTTDEGDGRIIKRPRRPSHYIDLIHDLPRRCILGNMTLDEGNIVLPSVLVKIIFIRELGELLGYLSTGNWAGDRAKHPFDAVDEADMVNVGINDDTTFDFHVRGKVPQQALKFWQDNPLVRRKHVKIQRIDYIGHSDFFNWYLGYGTKNDKGELPLSEILVSAKTLIEDTFAFGQKPHFAPDALCQFWGCFTGAPGGMAEQLTKLVPTVVACDTTTTFEHIANDDQAMPQPVPGGTMMVYIKPD
jgi:hypothetical protein